MSASSATISKNNCFLRELELIGKWPFGHGLIITEGKVSCNEDFFSCCRIPKLSADNSLAVCGRDQRLAAVQQLLNAYQAEWNKPLPKLPPVLEPVLARFLLALRRGENTGYAFRTKREIESPSLLLWFAAIFARWHWGLALHVSTAGGKGPLLPAAGSAVDAVLVDQKFSFSNAKAQNDFAALVSWSYGALRPLWVDLIPVAPNALPAVSPLHLGTMLDQRIQAQQNLPPLSLLGPDTRSRLNEICRGLEPYL